MNAPAQFGERTVTLTRIYDAPRALVWRAWTEPSRLAAWFGPRGFTSTVPELDLRGRRKFTHRHARAGRQRLSDEGRVQ